MGQRLLGGHCSRWAHGWVVAQGPSTSPAAMAGPLGLAAPLYWEYSTPVTHPSPRDLPGSHFTRRYGFSHLREQRGFLLSLTSQSSALFDRVLALGSASSTACFLGSYWVCLETEDWQQNHLCPVHPWNPSAGHSLHSLQAFQILLERVNQFFSGNSSFWEVNLVLSWSIGSLDPVTSLHLWLYSGKCTLLIVSPWNDHHSVLYASRIPRKSVILRDCEMMLMKCLLLCWAWCTEAGRMTGWWWHRGGRQERRQRWWWWQRWRCWAKLHLFLRLWFITTTPPSPLFQESHKLLPSHTLTFFPTHNQE